MQKNPRYHELLRLFHDGRLQEFRNHEIILRAGEEPPGVFMIKSGLVKVYSITDHGDENIHTIYQKGELFPLVWAFNGGIRNVFYEAFGSCELLRIPKNALLGKIKESALLTRLLLDQLASQFNLYTDSLDNLEYTDAQERVAHRLLMLAGRFGKKRSKHVLIDVPITHQLIASSINLARETVSREIEKLERLNLIGHQKRRIVLKDIEGLEAIIGEPVSPDLWGLK